MGQLRDWAGNGKGGIWHDFNEEETLSGLYRGFEMAEGKFEYPHAIT